MPKSWFPCYIGRDWQNGATIVPYQWIQTSGTPISLNGANTATPTFTAPTVATSLAFSLTVKDSTGAVSSPATVTVTVAGLQRLSSQTCKY